ncbi:MAG TPA: LysR family transcriptional regulator [Caldimonas sp.]|nr:LysR family transcriptional regulator [Caldimonas sp.]
MPSESAFGKIELQLVRVLHTVISERSVSRAAMRLGSSQPAVSAQLRRLRGLTGDALLVRAGNRMTPTDTALRLLGPAAALLDEAERLFGARARQRGFDPAASEATLRIAASDYLDPSFLPGIVGHVKRQAPSIRLELLPLSAEYDYRQRLAAGEVDLVVGNWLRPPGELHLGRLFSDEVVCLVAADHPATRRGWSADRYLAAEHVAPMPFHANAPGVVDDHLASLGLARDVAVKSAHFSLIPLMVAQSRLVLTTGRLFCSRFVDSLPLKIVRCPIAFPPLTYYQLWHEVTHASASTKWLREQIRAVARDLAVPAPARPS